MEINEPTTIAKLPQIQLGSGRYHFSEVYSLKGSTRRRRQEICAAVDGNSINIYEVRNGRAITSCPVPPDTTFTCAPCAVRVQNTESKTTKSIYYVSNRRGDLTLSLFCEASGDTASKQLTKTVALDNTSPVVQLDILAGPTSLELLIVREDGSFEVYDDKLSSQVRQGRFCSHEKSLRLLKIHWLSPLQALRSVLKARPDIVAASEPESSFVLGVLNAQDREGFDSDDVDVGVWQIPKSSSKMIGNTDLNPVVYHRLATNAALVSGERTPVSFFHRDTRLIIRTLTKTHTYDLTTIAPRKIYETSLTNANQVNSIPVSDTLTLSSTPNSLQLHNAQFGTLQSRLDIAAGGLKRKRTRSSVGQVSFITFFPQMSRAVAVRDGHLVAIDLRNTTGSNFSTATKHTSLLISNVGRAVASRERQEPSARTGGTSIGPVQIRNGQSAEWQNVANRLDQYCQSQDITGCEQLLLEEAGRTRPNRPNSPLVIPEWKANIAISKMLEVSKDAQGGSNETRRQLKVVLPAQRVFEALTFQGLLTKEKVSSALGVAADSGVDEIRSDQISQVLVDCDPSMDLLSRHLKQTPCIHRHELCATIQMLLRQALAQSRTESSQTTSLAMSTASRNKDVLPSITTCLCAAIQRLSESAPGSLPAYMRESFKQSDIIALIQFLRQQLFRSGYTRSLQSQTYPSPPASEPETEVEQTNPNGDATELTLTAIAATLSDCIDAIGPIGALGLGDDEQFVQALIPELLSEISRAAEALQDAAFLQGILRETLRFAESTVTSHDRKVAASDEKSADSQQRKSGTIVTLCSEPVNEGSTVGGLSALPLSLRSEGKIDSYKLRKGDGSAVKRSQREMGLLQERLRGPYALERLTLW